LHTMTIMTYESNIGSVSRTHNPFTTVNTEKIRNSSFQYFQPDDKSTVNRSTCRQNTVLHVPSARTNTISLSSITIFVYM
jgi:hypothetical protein